MIVTEAENINESLDDDTGDPLDHMTGVGESPREANNMMKGYLNPKENFKIGTWNVRTLNQISRLAQALKVMNDYKVGILGISECRWIGTGKTINQGYTILYSGHETRHTGGVGMILDKTASKALIEWYPVSDRILVVRLNAKYTKVTLIQVYAPTNQASDEDKNRFYDQLQRTYEKSHPHDLTVVMGDLNAKVGQDNLGSERCMGKHGVGERNENGEMFLDFCMRNNLTIGGTIFQHPNVHKCTWVSPDKSYTNQIDHMAINSKWRSSLLDVRVRRGADVNSDHFLVLGKFRLKLKKSTAEDKRNKVFDVTKLKDPLVKQEFKLNLQNRFQNLQVLDETETVESCWNNIKECYQKSAEEVIGFKKKERKEWISDDTWNLIEERKTMREKVLNEENLLRKRELETEYQRQDKAVKRNARRDKRKFAADLADEAEEAARVGNTAKLYKITKKLSGKSQSKSNPIKDRHGNKITNDKEVAERWKEHFQQVLNQNEPEEDIGDLINQPVLDIDINEPTRQEIKNAIDSMKKNKAPGVDGIQAELLQADTDLSADLLNKLFKLIWNSEEIPNDWQKGMIVRIPKKGDLSLCDNWRGITLISVPGKVFCKILLIRIDEEIDSKLREEQAGFRKGRGCIDQILALRNIIEQCLEWNKELHINFVDFKKAFDSVHRPAIWKILKSYGLPDKIIQMIKLFYENYECSVICENDLTEWFNVNTGVRQGCILSPILFLITIDWVMRKTIDQKRGVELTSDDDLEDLDFADDLALLAESLENLQIKTTRLENFAKLVGLQINVNKTKIMQFQNNNGNITIGDETVEKVDSFTYLGTTISTEEGTSKDIQSRLAKARTAFSMLRPIWRSTKYSRKTKLKIFKSNVMSVLLYGAECWRITQCDLNKLEVFQNRCLRQIHNIFWPTTISNINLHKISNASTIEQTLETRRLKLLGHVFRMHDSRLTKKSIEWEPTLGTRRRGRPKKTWRSTIRDDLRNRQLTWNTARTAAQDRRGWRTLLQPLAPTVEN